MCGRSSDFSKRRRSGADGRKCPILSRFVSFENACCVQSLGIGADFSERDADGKCDHQHASRRNPHEFCGFAIVGVAVRVRVNAGKVSFVRFGVTGLSNRAYRVAAAEKALEGKTSSPNDIQAAAALVAQGVDANSDLHASADYRRHLAVVHAARALRTALSRIA